MNWSPRHDPRSVQLGEAAELRRQPGIWHELEQARTVQLAGNKAHAIRTGRAAAFRPAGAYEARSQGRCVFVRYVGPPDPGSPSPRALTTARSPR